tara:strand:+ start:502 stop:810 length:309 start_codon:yes stop_codon:yes gene_type:complete
VGVIRATGKRSEVVGAVSGRQATLGQRFINAISHVTLKIVGVGAGPDIAAWIAAWIDQPVANTIRIVGTAVSLDCPSSAVRQQFGQLPPLEVDAGRPKVGDF